MLSAACVLSLFLVVQQLEARCARSPLPALLPPDPRMAQVCARPPADLSDERLKELHELALGWAQWAKEEEERRAAVQAEADAGPAESP